MTRWNFDIIRKRLGLGLVFLIFQCALQDVSSAQAAQVEKLLPKPQVVARKGFQIHFTKAWVIVTDSENRGYQFSALWLKRHLENSHSLSLKIINLNAAPPHKRIIICNPNERDSAAALLKKRGITLPSWIGQEGYILDVFNKPHEEIIIAATAPNGVFYGVQTLLQLITGRTVEGVHIVDYPDHCIRAVDVHFFRKNQLKGKPPRFTTEMKKAIDRLASMKINAISLYTGTDFFKSSFLYHKAYRDLAEYCKKRFIELIPGIGTLRSIAWVPFYLIEGWWVKDEVFRFGSGGLAIPQKPPINLLKNGGFEEHHSIRARSDKWSFIGKMAIDHTRAFQGSGSLRIDKGRAVLDVTVEPNSYYHLSAYAMGAPPVIGLAALDAFGRKLYGQSDYVKNNVPRWRKFGVVLRTNSQTSKLRVILTGKTKKNGAVWIDNVKLCRLNGALQNVIRTSTTDIKVTSIDKTVTYREGIDYEILNGQTNKKYDDSLRPFKIVRLKNGSIGPGQRVLVSYDCVLYWARTHWYNQPPCVSDERLYTRYYYPAIDRVIELLHPRIINLASDEIRGFNRDSRNKRRGLTNAQLFAEWLNKINRYVKSKDPDCRVMIWDDMVSPYHNGGAKDAQLKYGGSPGRMAEVIEKDMIDKDVILNVWWYNDRYYPLMVAATNFFNSKGLDFLGAPWFNEENIRSWAKLLLNQPHALGGLATNWGRNNFPAFADYFWNTRRAAQSSP